MRMKINEHRRNWERKKARKKTSVWKHDIGLLNFLRNITFTILATFQFFFINYPVNPQTLNHAPCTFFTRWLIISNVELLTVVLEAGSKLAQFCTKFKVKWVLFLCRNVLVCGYWNCTANQYSKITGFIKNFEEDYGY